MSITTEDEEKVTGLCFCVIQYNTSSKHSRPSTDTAITSDLSDLALDRRKHTSQQDVLCYELDKFDMTSMINAESEFLALHSLSS